MHGRNYLQIHGAAIGTKMAVTLANIFMADIEIQILSQSVVKLTGWKRLYICSLWDTGKRDIEKFFEQANSSFQQSNLRLKSPMLRLQLGHIKAISH